MINDEAVNRYIENFSSSGNEALEWLVRQTNLRTNHARMLSGRVVGKFLEFVSCMLRPQRILEIGCFTGYSSICLASGLAENGILDTIEINDELEDLIREAFERSGLDSKIRLRIGDAKKIIPGLDDCYDLAYIDANKREYCQYYEIVFDMVRPGGYILADNVLWSGKVCLDPLPQDKQTAGIARFNDMVVNDPRVESVILPVRDGLNIIRKLG